MDIKSILNTDYPFNDKVEKVLPDHWVRYWLLDVLNKSNAFLITDATYTLTPEQQADFERGITQMQAGTPLAYLTGKQAFWSLEFKVNEHTLIPRPETELLVELVLQWVNKNGEKPNNHIQSSPSTANQLLDLGTGSGCIAISLGHELNNLYANEWQVTAIDYSAEALLVAKENALLNKVSNIEFVKSDWFSALADKKHHQKFDIIVANPPYINPDDAHLSLLRAEPLSALVAEDKGLCDIKIICSQSTSYLTKGGLLAIEHGHDQKQEVQTVFQSNGFKDVTTVKDYAGNDRITMGTMI